MNATSLLSNVSVGLGSRAAHFADGLRARSMRAGLTVWHALEAYGHARAMREIRALHDRWVISDPELAQQLRATGALAERR
jgi:hypothetical protein